MKAFISYSHNDESALDRLHKHLAMLRREGALEDWYDRDILAGDVVDAEISRNLEACEIFLALVSPDFLSSDYCYDKEMTKALKRHAEGAIRVIPIIVEPCDWQASPLGQLKALPKDGKPIREWTNENAAYLDVVTEIRRVVSTEGGSGGKPQVSAVPSPATSTRYRIKKRYDEIDRSDFRDAAFREIREYFRQSIAEVDTVDGLRARFREISPQGFTCTVLNQMKDRSHAHITIHAGSVSRSLGDITYTFTENGAPNSANGWLTIESDEYDLYLVEHGFRNMGASGQRVTSRSAAELLWQEFLSHAGIDYA